jgi:hypothetical protein
VLGAEPLTNTKMKLYKLTNENGYTYNKTLWGEGVSHSGTGKGPICSEGWIHAYEHPFIAVFLNPIHAYFKNPRMWEAEGKIDIRDGQLKVGCKTLKTIKEIPLPKVQDKHFIIFGALALVQASSTVFNSDEIVRFNNGELLNLLLNYFTTISSNSRLRMPASLLYQAASALRNSSSTFDKSLIIRYMSAKAVYYCNTARPPLDLISIAEKNREYLTDA